MRTLFLLLPFLALLSLTSCEEKRFFKQYREIPLLQWKQENELKYEVDIADNAPKFRLALALRYAAHLPHRTVTLTLSTTSPTGKTTKKPYTIAIKDEKDHHNGEIMGEIADLEQVIEASYTFAEKGKYQFSIRQEEAKELGGFQEIGVVLYKDDAKK